MTDNPIFSVGGKMGKAPLKPVTHACRERDAAPDLGVIAAFCGETISELRSIERDAERLDIDTTMFSAKIDALEGASPSQIMDTVERSYSHHFGGEHQLCPYEDSRNRLHCYRCPVAGDAITHLLNQNTAYDK